jgi:tRNA G18 (ribose-2'-O)-methylase SpoU
MRGYWGIGIYHTKTEVNVGTLLRSAYSFGADFAFTVGRRYKKQSSDTLKTWRHIPLWHFSDLDDLRNHLPYTARLVCIEIAPGAIDLSEFEHPDQAVYLLGAEDHGLPSEILAGNKVVKISGADHCLNVAVAGSIVMYDRKRKAVR